MSERQVRWSIAAEEWLKSVDDASVGDVLIVGTGYGGSFAARELAAPDRRVWVLERGREHALGEFAQDIGSLPGQVRIQKAADSAGIGNTDGVLDFRRHGDVSVLVGNGLGGGSLVNAGVAVLPDPALFTHPAWPAHYREHAAHRVRQRGHFLKPLRHGLHPRRVQQQPIPKGRCQPRCGGDILGIRGDDLRFTLTQGCRREKQRLILHRAWRSGQRACGGTRGARGNLQGLGGIGGHGVHGQKILSAAL